MRKIQSGFTLIELVVVITILGILAALALPRFAALQTEARIAKMNAALGALKAGAALAHSVQLTQSLANGATFTMEGATITLVNGYPNGTTIGAAAGITTPDYVITPAATATLYTVTPDAGHALCAVTYTAATVAGGVISPPTYSNTGLTSANCS